MMGPALYAPLREQQCVVRAEPGYDLPIGDCLLARSLLFSASSMLPSVFDGPDASQSAHLLFTPIFPTRPLHKAIYSRLAFLALVGAEGFSTLFRSWQPPGFRWCPYQACGRFPGVFHLLLPSPGKQLSSALAKVPRLCPPPG